MYKEGNGRKAFGIGWGSENDVGDDWHRGQGLQC